MRPQANIHGSGELHLAYWHTRLKRVENPCYVYVIRGDEGGPVKIGRAIDVAARMKGLQTGNPQLLRLLYVLPGGSDLERHLHKLLHWTRIKGTEWFRVEHEDAQKVLAYIASLAQRMVDSHGETGDVPHWKDVDPYKLARVRRNVPDAPVTVRFVDPDPVVPPDEAARMRESVRGCDRAVWQGPATIARQRITRNPGFGGNFGG